VSIGGPEASVSDASIAEPSSIAERARTGQDIFDEVWEGTLHVVPPPSNQHQRIGTKLARALFDAVEQAGLQLRYETGVFDPGPGPLSYRTPDLAIFDDRHGSDRGVEGHAAIVVEIRSPGDETFEKLPFYDRVGVGEVVVIDRDTLAVSRWVRCGGHLVDTGPRDDGWFELSRAGIRLRGGSGALFVESPGGSFHI
jgi:Uma2 family endonuclease